MQANDEFAWGGLSVTADTKPEWQRCQNIQSYFNEYLTQKEQILTTYITTQWQALLQELTLVLIQNTVNKIL